ncbi:hypothetical protein FB446DRAFT_715223 [Lentinula raphanica]|nr:hypothetical protein FB446DRAFT_715223 [Lentinula raphanica]
MIKTEKSSSIVLISSPVVPVLVVLGMHARNFQQYNYGPRKRPSMSVAGCRLLNSVACISIWNIIWINILRPSTVGEPPRWPCSCCWSRTCVDYSGGQGTRCEARQNFIKV